MTTTTTPITANTTVVIAKGCRAREVTKGAHAHVRSITPLGAEGGHFVKVVLVLRGDRVVVFYARHQNRLGDTTVRLNDGNPLHAIEIRRA